MSPPGKQPQAAITGTPILEIFDNLDHAMIISGGPGSGKTTKMKELLHELLAVAAIEGSNGLIPIFLPLASWTLRKEPVEQWVMREISERHRIAARHVRAWLEEEQLALLLDGLDEVGSEFRHDCVKAVKAFRQKYGTVPIAVSCRTGEYERFPESLALSGVVTIQPLDRQQVERYLDPADTHRAGARAALDHAPGLWEMVDTPLALRILSLAFSEGTASGDLASRTPQELLNTLFAQYVPTMLRQRAAADQPPSGTVRRIAFLARQLERQEQTTFKWDLIDIISLPERWWVHAMGLAGLLLRMAISVLGMAAVAAALFGMPGALAGAIAGLLSGFGQNLRVSSIGLAVQARAWPWEQNDSSEIVLSDEDLAEARLDLSRSLTAILTETELADFITLLAQEVPEAGLAARLNHGTLEERLTQLLGSNEVMHHLTQMPEDELSRLIGDVVPEREFLRRTKAYQRDEDDDYEPYLMQEFDEIALQVMDSPDRRLRVRVLRSILHVARRGIGAIERWRHFRHRLQHRFYYLGDVSSAGLLAVLVISITTGAFLGWPYATATVLSGLATLLLMTAVSKVRLRARNLAWGFPSPGLRAALRIGALAAPTIALLAGGMAGLVVGLTATAHQGARFAIVTAGCVALFVIMRIGGSALIEQIQIRLVLNWMDLTPVRGKHFLDYATQCLFLQQSGQDYQFLHRSMQEFFAGLCPDEDTHDRRNEPDPRLVDMLVPAELAQSVGKAAPELDSVPVFEEQLGPPAMAVARAWYTNAAIKGNADAQYGLGVLLAERLEPPDLTGARTWLTKAAEAGHIAAQHYLGLILASLPTPELSRAQHWLTRAANSGDPGAQCSLGQFLEQKLGSPRHHERPHLVHASRPQRRQLCRVPPSTTARAQAQARRPATRPEMVYASRTSGGHQGSRCT